MFDFLEGCYYKFMRFLDTLKYFSRDVYSSLINWFSGYGFIPDSCTWSLNSHFVRYIRPRLILYRKEVQKKSHPILYSYDEEFGELMKWDEKKIKRVTNPPKHNFDLHTMDTESFIEMLDFIIDNIDETLQEYLNTEGLSLEELAVNHMRAYKLLMLLLPHLWW